VGNILVVVLRVTISLCLIAFISVVWFLQGIQILAIVLLTLGCFPVEEHSFLITLLSSWSTALGLGWLTLFWNRVDRCHNALGNVPTILHLVKPARLVFLGIELWLYPDYYNFSVCSVLRIGLTRHGGRSVRDSWIWFLLNGVWVKRLSRSFEKRLP